MVNARSASILALVFSLVACAGSAGNPTPDPSPDPTPVPTGPARGEKCASGACGAGLTCVQYVAMTGQPLDSCEIPCGADGTCGAGESCQNAADGPTNVCRAGEAALPAQGKECPAGACAAGLTCVEYLGIAGGNGPKFTSCEIPCPGKTACPDSQKCVRIADGPGEVCRP